MMDRHGESSGRLDGGIQFEFHTLLIFFFLLCQHLHLHVHLISRFLYLKINIRYIPHKLSRESHLSPHSVEMIIPYMKCKVASPQN